ncbi:MAG: ABC transporter substrate-binding protein [Betaproteobacteria bacterium]|nr:MAG: ABC transporter substrate-binding protein [Betaproteobacteria bacterium]
MPKKYALVVAALSAIALAPGVMAQDAYVVGLSGALTGPQAGTYAPVMESFKLYVDQLNRRGGVNGKPVRLVVQDNQGEPSKAAADAKKLISQDNAIFILNASVSSTYAPMAAEAKRGRVPLLYSVVCPVAVFPPNPDEFQFCSAAGSANYDSEMAVRYIKELSRNPVRLGLAAMAIPVSRGGIDHAEEVAKSFGITVVDKQIIPPPTPDYTPYASKLKSAEPDWVYSWAPWVTQVKTLEALRKLGWNGKFLAYAVPPTEDEVIRLKDGEMHAVSGNAFFNDNLPLHKEIRDAAGKANLTYPVTQLSEGWIAGMVLEQALKNTSWPPTAEKVLAAMNDLSVDTKGLRGGPIEWTKTNHFRTKQYYRFYRWDSAKQTIVPAKEGWTMVEIK